MESPGSHRECGPSGADVDGGKGIPHPVRATAATREVAEAELARPGLAPALDGATVEKRARMVGTGAQVATAVRVDTEDFRRGGRGNDTRYGRDDDGGHTVATRLHRGAPARSEAKKCGNAEQPEPGAHGSEGYRNHRGLDRFLMPAGALFLAPVARGADGYGMHLPEETWLYVRSDGTLEAVETVPESADPLPGLWVGRPLLQSSELPEPLLEALRELLPRPLGIRPVQRRTLTIGAGRVHVIRIDGIPLRRAYTPLVETILRALDPLIVQATQARVALVVERSEFTATTAHLDGEKIAWALVTLVGNALRHTTAGGTIHVSLRSARGGDFFVSSRRSAGSENLELTVEDDGAGIPEERLRHLFEHDPTTGRRAGLALVLVRDIVVAHGGTVAVSRGKQGKGTVFSLQIPRQ